MTPAEAKAVLDQVARQFRAASMLKDALGVALEAEANATLAEKRLADLNAEIDRATDELGTVGLEIAKLKEVHAQKAKENTAAYKKATREVAEYEDRASGAETEANERIAAAERRAEDAESNADARVLAAEERVAEAEAKYNDFLASVGRG